MKRLIFAILVLAVTMPGYAADDSSEEKGLFSKGSFFSEAISSVTDKIGKVSSGDERIISDDAKGVNKEILEYDRDPLGRSLPKPRSDDFVKTKKSDKGE